MSGNLVLWIYGWGIFLEGLKWWWLQFGPWPGGGLPASAGEFACLFVIAHIALEK